MATAKEKEDIANLKTDMAVVKNDIRYMKSDMKKVVDFVDTNRGGITTSSLLNSKIVSYVLGGIVAAGIYFAAKGGI